MHLVVILGRLLVIPKLTGIAEATVSIRAHSNDGREVDVQAMLDFFEYCFMSRLLLVSRTCNRSHDLWPSAYAGLCSSELDPQKELRDPMWNAYPR